MPVALGGLTLLFLQVPQLAALVARPPAGRHDLDLLPRRAAAVDACCSSGRCCSACWWWSPCRGCCACSSGPDRDYRLYGIRYWAHRTIAPDDQPASSSPGSTGTAPTSCTTCAASGTTCAGSSRPARTSGPAVKHDNPFLSSVGRGTVVADGLSFINADYSSTHFRVSRVAVGAHNFLGNRIAYPAQGRTGDNCLLATKVMVPLDGKVREGVGLLGSPSFEIPRTVERDQQLDVTDPDGAAPQAAAPRTGTTPSPSCCSCCPAGCSPRCSPCSRWPPSISTRSSGCWSPRWPAAWSCR